MSCATLRPSLNLHRSLFNRFHKKKSIFDLLFTNLTVAVAYENQSDDDFF